MTRIGVIGSGCGSRSVCRRSAAFLFTGHGTRASRHRANDIARLRGCFVCEVRGTGLTAPKMDLLKRTLSSGALYLEAVKKSIVARAGGACGARWRSEEEAMC